MNFKKYSQTSLFADSISANSPTCYNLSVTPKSILIVLSRSLSRHVHRRKKQEPGDEHLTSRAHTGDTLPSCFCCHTVNKCPFHGLSSATLLFLFDLHRWLPYLKWPPRACSLVSLSRKRLWCALMEKNTLNKLCLGMTYSAVGCEFNVNESTIHIMMSLNKNTHKTKIVLVWIGWQNCDQRLAGTHPCIFPRNNGSVFENKGIGKQKHRGLLPGMGRAIKLLCVSVSVCVCVQNERRMYFYGRH